MWIFSPKRCRKGLRHGGRGSGAPAEMASRSFGSAGRLSRPDSLSKKTRHAGKHRGAGRCQAGENRARQAVIRNGHRHASAEQRHDEIGKAVRVRERDDAVIQITLADTHAGADLLAIRHKVVRPKPDRPRRARGAGGQFQEVSVVQDAPALQLPHPFRS